MKYKQHKQYRLPYYNYASSGIYFVTICTKNREELLGSIQNHKTQLSKIGSIVNECLVNIPVKWRYIHLDEFVIMPNHIHGLLVIDNPGEGREIKEIKFYPQKKSLSFIVRNFKAIVTLLVRKDLPGADIWQSRFYDRIVRNEKELNNIRLYIQNNPIRWETDRNNTENLLM
ncbi:MAG: transposase [Bacteroidota bacterium]|jgi:REP element-mobilizing transposase RayT